MKKNKVYRLFITVAIIAGALFTIGYILAANKKKNAEKTAIVSQIASSSVPVKTAQVEKIPMMLGFSANGNFEPVQQLNFAAENSGRVVKVLVDEGTQVRIGQTLAIIKTDVLEIELETAKASYENALKDMQRYEAAYETGGVTRQQLDQAKLALENAKARLGQARIRIDEANIKSSINGIVNKRYIEPGAVVSPGTQLFELVDISKLKLSVSVNENQVAGLKVGDKVEVAASVFPDRKYTGTIIFIAAKADASLNFPVDIEIGSNPDNQLRAGMYGTAFFGSNEEVPVLAIPRSAFLGSVSSNQVFVAENGTVARLKTVVAGRIFGDNVEILKGLNIGETIITSGQINLSDGTKITPIK